MTVESDFYSLLSSAAGVTAQVAARIYPDALPEQCAYPAVVFARARTEPLVGLSGNIFGADVDLAVGCWAKTRTAADAAAAAIEAAIAGTAFVRAGRDAAFDPDAGLYAAQLTVTTFSTGA